MGEVQIRQAVPEDLSALNTVHAAGARAEWGMDVLHDPDRFVVVAVVDGVLVAAGKTHFFSEPDGPAPAGHYLGGVTVHPDHRRRGIGVAVTHARMDWVWARSDRVYYFTDEHNAASVLMHAALGFEEIARGPTIRGRHADVEAECLILFCARRPATG